MIQVLKISFKSRPILSYTEYVRFWFDAIHCYWSTTQKNRLDPPIIVVCTKEDKFKVNMGILSKYASNITVDYKNVKKYHGS